VKQAGWQLRIKVGVDRLVAAAGLVGLAPLYGICAAAVAASIGRPVIFRQPRPGLGGRVFEVLKFRTMTEARDARGALLPDAERLTRVGRILRELSLDELPQLWNVLRGEMSLVGPRPLLVSYLARYSPEQQRRHDVLPGITGWAQVGGRNALGWDDKFALDVFYVDHWSLALDAKIMALTALAVTGRRGIASDGHATMPEFRGREGTA
jgi:lipopolysaccharide/colanic/teichoic acid biosynthesis glycosyltransferase